MRTIELYNGDTLDRTIEVEDERFAETMQRARLSAELKTQKTGVKWIAKEKVEVTEEVTNES